MPPLRKKKPAPKRTTEKPGTDVQVSSERWTSKYPWHKIRVAFIEGMPVQGTEDERHFPTQREVAEIFEVPYERVRKVASQERWTAKREAAEMEAIQERLKKRAKQIAKNALDFDEKAHNAAKLGMAMVTTRLAEIAKDVQVRKPLRDAALQKLANGQSVTKEELYSAIRASELNELANAADRFQSLGMKALGTDVQRVDIAGLEGNTTNVNVVNVRQEIQRDDVERMASMLEAMTEAGLVSKEILDNIQDSPELQELQQDPNTIDAEVVEEQSDPEPERPRCDEHEWDDDRDDMAVCVKCGHEEPWEDDEDDTELPEGIDA